jgi:pyruvate-ferredoxin/flavodoxin oxidoreductase
MRSGQLGRHAVVMSRQPPFPGIPTICDGSEAIASVETRISEGACSYPITPSTTMPAVYQAAVANGRANLWGTPLAFLEPESEHSSASAAEGFALAGGRVVNFTAGQGLILMKEVLYVIAGKRLPAVFHIGARALTSQSLNIHAGHDDVMGVADCGWGILFARNVQEAADFTAIARRVAEETSTPFFVVQDGFLTTHTLENAALPEDDLLRDFVGDPRDRLSSLFDPATAIMSGVVSNQDAYMPGRIGQRAFYEQLSPSLTRAFDEWATLTGREYGLINTDAVAGAETVLVAMGTIADSARAVVEHLRSEGRNVGAIGVAAYRPFPAELLADAVADCRAVAVIERTDEPAAADNPLTRELKAALADRAARGASVPIVVSASGGLGSRDVSAGDLVGVFDWLDRPDLARGPRWASLGVRHPSALAAASVNMRPAGAYSLRGHSIGGLGSVTTNKLLATIMGELFGKYVQAYPRYGSEKKGLPTTYFLTLADAPIRMHAELKTVDFVPLHDVSAFHQGALSGLVDGGTVFVQSPLVDPRQIWGSVPESARDEITARGLRLIALDTASMARRRAPRAELVLRMQGVALVGVFLRVAPFAAAAGYGRDRLLVEVRKRLGRFYGKRGAAVIDANLELITEAYDTAIDVTAALADTKETADAA